MPVTLAGLEPASSPAPENKDALSPLSYSVVTIFMTVCGGARASRLPAALSTYYFSILIVRVVVAPQSSQV
jgi:hypothetical protein